jgi:glycosyltransferase involved in cell wall biosynthesis
MSNLSFCMITMVNEGDEQMFADCLESIKPFNAEELIVVMDTRSTELAVKIARDFGAQVHMREWTDSFAEGRNFSIQLATKRWTGIIDADERYEVNDIPRILELLDSEEIYAGIKIQTLSESPNGMTLNFPPRFFLTGKGRYEGEKHHALALDGAMRFFPARIYHKGYNLSPAKQKAKNKRDIAIMEKQLEADPHNTYTLRNLIRSLRSAGEWQKVLETSIELDRIVQTYRLQITDVSMQMTMLDTAFAHIHLGQYIEAIGILADAAKAFDYNPDLHFYLGNVCFIVEDYQSASVAYENYLKAFHALRMSQEPPDIICETWSFLDRAYKQLSYTYAAIGEDEKSSQACMAGFMNMAQVFISEYTKRILSIKKRKEAIEQPAEEEKPKIIMPFAAN